MEKTKIDIFAIIVATSVVLFLFGLIDWVLVIILRFSHSFSVIILSLVTVVLISWIWRKRDSYWEDLLELSFDEKTIKLAKLLKERKDEERERFGV